MKKETSFSRNKQKPKLVVSFNGAFRSRSGKIRYVGGESRIISVDRDVDFSKLRSKISELSNTSRCFTLTCRASDSDPMLSIDTDDDVRLMIDLYGNDFSTTRLWIYVSNSGGDGDDDDSARDLIGMNVKMCDNYKSSDSGVDNVSVKNDFGDFSCSGGGDEGLMSDKDKNHSSPPPLIDFDSPLEYYMKKEFLDELNRLDEISKGYLSDNWDYSNSIQFPVSRKQTLDLKDDDLLVEIWDTSLDCLLGKCGQVIERNAKQELINNEPELKSKLKMENNVAKNYVRNNHMKTRFPKVFSDIKPTGNAIRINRIRISGGRNRRVCSYHVENRQNSLQHGKVWCGLKPSKNISKQAKYVRLYHSNYWKADFRSQTSALEKKFNMDHGGDREAAAKLSSSHGIVTVGSGINSTLESSMHNLSLSSSKLESPLLSCITSICVSHPKHEWRPFDDLMDEGRLSIISPKKRSIGISMDEMNQDPSLGLNTEEKVNIKEEGKHCKITGDKNVDGLPVITHLATKKIQTIKSTDLEYIKELGSGTYGSVFYGQWRGSDVAIKKVKPGCCSDDPVAEDRVIKEFWKEAHILNLLRHPNILALYGVVTDGPPMNLAMVTEYMVNGSLKQVLNKKDRTIDRRKRLIIAMDAAFGMEYLHEKNIVHFDLKSHNLLVNMRDPHRPTCKIGDLGLAKIKQNNLVSGGVRGTIPWMAPELLDFKNNMVTEKIDVYSFGIVMWELLTGEDPYSNLRSKEVIAGIIKGDLRPEVPSWCDPQWRSLMKRCWSSDPTSRPSFSEIVKELRAMAAEINIK